MKTYIFDCKGNNAPAYSCSEPGDNSGLYVKKESMIEPLNKLISILKAIEGGSNPNLALVDLAMAIIEDTQIIK